MDGRHKLSINALLFTAWMILSSLFGCKNLIPAAGFLQTMMPKIFKWTGHHSTDQIGDCFKFKLQNASNCDLNILTFSNYKNTTTEKALHSVLPLKVEG